MAKNILASGRRRMAAAAAAIFVAGAGAGLGTYTVSGPALAQEVTVPQEQRSTAFNGFADVVDRVSPAVVSVRVSSNVQPTSAQGDEFSFGIPGLEDLPEDHPFRRFFRDFGPGMPNGEQNRRGGPRNRALGQGSGFFISADGYLVTNNHVVDGGSDYTVVLDDGSELSATLIGTDPRTDLAVLKVDADRELPFVQFADESEVRVGDWVLAIGNPFGLGGSVTAGIVSALGRDIGAGPYDDFLQIDAPVNRGNSGGPAFNTAGRVIGINTAIFSPSGGNVGIAFAIPSTSAERIVNDLIDDGEIERGWLGIQIGEVTDDVAEAVGLDEARGALVQQPTEFSPADQAGVQAGDVIVAVNGQPIEGPRDLSRTIAELGPQQTAELEVFRDGQSQTIDVQLGLMPNASEMASNESSDRGSQSQPSQASSLDEFGLTVTPAEDGNGLLVTDVQQGSAAEERGISAGDTLTKVNSTDVSSVEELQSAIEAASERGRNAVLVQVQSNDRQRFVALPIGQG